MQQKPRNYVKHKIEIAKKSKKRGKFAKKKCKNRVKFPNYIKIQQKLKLYET